jgi:hypothetical protein
MCYEYRLVTVDAVGLTRIGTRGGVVAYDTTAPAVAVTTGCGGPMCVHGSPLTASGTYSDQGVGFGTSTISAHFDDGSGDAGDMTNCNASAGQWSCGWTPPAAGNYTITVSGSDLAGNHTTSAGTQAVIT